MPKIPLDKEICAATLPPTRSAHQPSTGSEGPPLLSAEPFLHGIQAQGLAIPAGGFWPMSSTIARLSLSESFEFKTPPAMVHVGSVPPGIAPQRRQPVAQA